MNKDKDKQREANRRAQARFKAKATGITDGGITQNVGEVPKGITEPRVLPSATTGVLIPRLEVTEHSNVRVSKPGDADYFPKCETTRAFVENRAKQPSTAKEIKCFEDLPPDVQQTIRTISSTDEEFQRRAGIAIRYQHLFPDRYHSTGAAL